jgi:hypothetical protein
MKMVVYGRALERNGFRPEDRDLVRLYSYDGKTQYWVREDGVRRADTLSVRTTRTGTYALGIEVNLNNDVTPPDIFESGPRGTVGTASPEVFATIRDDLNGTGIDLSRSRIVVDADTLTTTFDPVNLRLFGVPAKPLGSGTHAVTVIAADNSGNIGTETFAFIVDLGEGVGEEPLEFAVSAPYPNPFNPSTTIRYTLPKDCAVEFVVYDIRGARVAVLASGFRKAGRHDAVWNGRTLSGAEAASGVYLYRVKAGGRTAQGKVVLVR